MSGSGARTIRLEFNRESRNALPAKRSHVEFPNGIAMKASEKNVQRVRSSLNNPASSEFRDSTESDIHFAVARCSLGAILVAQSARGLCALLLGDDADELVRDLQGRFPEANLIDGQNAYKQLVARVIRFVERPVTGLDLPLDVRGTEFQRRVWQALCDIPPGSTASYSDIARRIGSPKAARAVAQACAANALAVAIPCHRVVRHDGGISGYRWGVDRKRAVLSRESGA